ncbi:putative metalloprotease CJM1_0395 family protein [Marinomonas mediterranea]|jgi:SprA-related family.|uniref:SprA-related family n=1 Tax=Marinomonas mediterranea (strain ATCC 700492 / JCM 21426 / NBRC 103028 / MMB-1) TaxID=717774 RepID=F2K3E2_MARM1|nr:putative metalloprotease CJM1_0395 family protein [Marinomonas mediterranea]ADZ91284.1 hypothetical protein Marme_2036 [Marinomonas mediterranea MMB-1]WCN09255.1 hypothetical protein GV055_10115 [Marinomonas mediterranea]WCN17405.1 hypothetical protein GV053_10250 [Marinomonas mediterranea MMB-1]
MSGSVSLSIESYSAYSSRQEGVAVSSNSVDTEDSIGLRAASDYSVTLSEESQQAFSDDAARQESNNVEDEPTIDSSKESDSTEQAESSDDSSPNELSEEEQQQVEKLQDRHDEVVTHEQAHASVGGQYAGSPQYSYEQGPDGQRYAVDGEVQIDVGKVSGDPEATIAKMEQVYRAALAPAEPSAADQNVAREAQSNIAEAKADIAKSTTETSSGSETVKSGENDSEAGKSNSEEPAQSGNTIDSSKATQVNSNQTLLSAYENSYTGNQSVFSAIA